MGAKDTKAKEFLSNNERFADLFNYYLFDGNPTIQPSDLSEQDTTKVLSIFGADRKEIQKQKWRDLLKRAIIKTTDYCIFILLGVENQSEVHYAMPVRNMIYDAMEYSTQINQAARIHKNQKEYSSTAEFLSGFKKDDKLTPVITLTVYWGADKWDAPRSLHEMISSEYASMLKYVDDYHLHLIIPEEISDFSRFRTSLREVLEFIKASNSEEMMEQVIHNNPNFRQLENDAISAINIFTGIDIQVNQEGGRTDMCKAWEDHRESGIELGRTEGIELGRTEGGIEALILDNLEDGKPEEVIIGKLVKRFGLEPDTAKEYFDKYSKETV